MVGVVGGGQLARMMQQAAIGLGVELRVLAQRPDDPAARVTPGTVIGDHHDFEALKAFAAGCDVLTFDHEHVPTDFLHELEAAGVAVRPGPDALVYAQDKGLMRQRLSALGLPCPQWALISSADDLADFGATVGFPFVLKATRGGYDGRGVWVVDDLDAAKAVLDGAAERGVALLAEAKVPFVRELSAQVARSPHGQAAAYPVVESLQIDGICREVYVPAPGLSEVAAVEAQRIALTIAKELGVTGMLAVEMFETADGSVLINELAMRPHNSGHWSMDGAVTGQFEQHLRAVLDLPLGQVKPVAPVVVMANVLGLDLPEVYPAYKHVMAHDPGVKVHMYGKDVKPGRKIGHVNVLGTVFDDVADRARHAAAYLRGEIDE
ncbi:phosphoribosylaminoimidazole carboxylase, ATPase subunit [Catenulispora acidiphila DSM 44928]|uniref:N5-carboxyaminoimidazole ribonucleotide synthase n=1 Tax=Catenulispora acidiphila (strain DSM 44928 / JCM 14897 / NBRC 102108 / NRRL B-24433 / ID139908) TaxID=479433 RepID=C7Q2D1_CATAD|nr:phosphoribosylaminoimidazole carboxylase, ATPase subunit [Catenulispora acidiphila DSM 44928]